MLHTLTVLLIVVYPNFVGGGCDFSVGVAHFLRVRRCLFRHFRYFDYEMPEAISRVIEI